MSNINCGIGVLHVKRQILTYFFVTSFLCSLKFLLFQLIGHAKKCLKKNMAQFLSYYCTFKNCTGHTDTHTHTDRHTDRPGENNTSQPPPGAR